MPGSFSLKDYLNCLARIPELSEEDVKFAMEARAKGYGWAHRLLEERFLSKVVRWVLPYRGRGVEFEALIEAGNRALLKGLRQLKPGLVVDATDYLERCVVEGVEAIVFAPR